MGTVTRGFVVWMGAGLVAFALAGCNLVLGIDEVSSANGPDSGQSISSVSTDPEAGTPGEDSGQAGDRPE